MRAALEARIRDLDPSDPDELEVETILNDAMDLQPAECYHVLRFFCKHLFDMIEPQSDQPSTTVREFLEAEE